MTSKEEGGKAGSVEERRRSPLDHLPPPANSNKPLTPFSIEDILNKPSVRRSYAICGTAAHLLSAAAEKHPPAALPLSSRALLSQTSPLCALEELASKTFKGLEVSVLQAAEGKPPALPRGCCWAGGVAMAQGASGGSGRTQDGPGPGKMPPTFCNITTTNTTPPLCVEIEQPTREIRALIAAPPSTQPPPSHPPRPL